jgi:dephospho-CoA kinase
MLKLGLTGGIACGKTVVGEMFVALGAYLIQADRISHELMRPGEPVYHEVVRHFGHEILNPDATVNRARLAELAFGVDAHNKSRVEELNRIVHPEVVRRQDEWMQEIGRCDPHAIAIVEAALILEAGAASHFDRLIVVACTEEQRISRFATRQKITLEAAKKEVTRRMAAQLPEEQKMKAANFVIDNSGSLEHTSDQVQQVWRQLQAGTPRL